MPTKPQPLVRSTVKKATDQRLKDMIQKGHPNSAACLDELRCRYDIRNHKMVMEMFSSHDMNSSMDHLKNCIPVLIDRCRELVSYEIVCNLHAQFNGK